ncbi:hypothetical protein GCM10008018_28900 [Paenibacillus marchantiophytorum]|uniref:Uncharacterized protein n=1 Tax=Paenibacillus marchantiophytorum TaxID=1619310 RepID=A0ABQ1EPL5_9BACL|nr:hypothetical protein GCM10008018_28900 [Paenibacillus marchantiophytorum]
MNSISAELRMKNSVKVAYEAREGAIRLKSNVTAVPQEKEEAVTLQKQSYRQKGGWPHHSLSTNELYCTYRREKAQWP